MKQNLKRILAIWVVLFITNGSTTLVGQTTNLGTNSGTGGINNVYIGAEAGKVSTANQCVNVGYQSGRSNTTGHSNAFFGHLSGYTNTTGSNNVFLGQTSGFANTTGQANSFVGKAAGYYNTTGQGNSFLGMWAGISNTTGSWNTFLGHKAGYTNLGGYQNLAVGNNSFYSNTSGINNCIIGYAAAYGNTTGTDNTCLGSGAGSSNSTGSFNVFLGRAAGASETGSNKLYIANSNTSTPLIYGEFDNQKMIINGKLGISTSTFPTMVGTANVSTYKLFVKGGILTEELRVRTGWADYVFNDNYKLMPLQEVENFIITNNHLPNVPTEEQILSEGLDVGNIAKIQQEKIEELTLYLIDLNKKLDLQEKKIRELENNINK
jgi:hypothetical protein